MYRFFKSAENLKGDYIEIRDEDYHHIMHSLRMKNGEKIEIVLEDKIYLCSVSLEDQAVHAHIIEQIAEQTESSLKMTLYQALLKGERMDFVFQKATELGVDCIVPVMLDRCVVKWDQDKWQKKRLRYEKIVEQAAKQSHRARIPEIGALKNLSEIPTENLLWFYECGEKKALKDQLPEQCPANGVGILIGPEGGFSLAEVEYLKEKNIAPLSLGPRILRAETAPIAALAVLQFCWGDF